jgi:hypothetical protein
MGLGHRLRRCSHRRGMIDFLLLFYSYFFLITAYCFANFIRLIATCAYFTFMGITLFLVFYSGTIPARGLLLVTVIFLQFLALCKYRHSHLYRLFGSIGLVVLLGYCSYTHKEDLYCAHTTNRLSPSVVLFLFHRSPNIGWYTLSFIPYGRDMLKSICKQTCCGCLRPQNVSSCTTFYAALPC